MNPFKWLPSMWWLIGALLSIVAMISIDVSFTPHMLGTFFLVPEFICLAMYSSAKRRELLS